MTLKEYKERTQVRHGNGYSQYEVTMTYRGKEYHCKSNNSLAWDRLDDGRYSDVHVSGGYTNKGAWRSFYEECKSKNNIA